MLTNNRPIPIPPDLALVRGLRAPLFLYAALALSACDDDDELASSPTAAEVSDGDFAERSRELELGTEGPDVAAAYAYLRRFGYFPSPELAEIHPGWTPVIDREPEDPNLFDLELEEALTKYQQAHGLPATGRLDAATRALMEQPRCGHPDYFTPPGAARPLASASAGGAPLEEAANLDLHAASTDPSKYQFFPSSSTISDLRYGVSLYTADVDKAFQNAHIDAAAKTWSAVGPVVLSRRSGQDVTINFVPHAHGSPPDFDSSTYSHHSAPNCNQTYDWFWCHTMIFLNDQSFTWGTGNGSTVQDLQTHALHEFGHALGLAHSNDSNSVMYSVLPPGLVRRSLASDDINGLKARYPTFQDLRIYEPQWYLDLNPIIAQAYFNDPKAASAHWVKYGRNAALVGSPAFDVRYYLAANPSVAQSIGATNYAEAFWHWRESGLKNGLPSSPAFNVQQYLYYWPDLKAEFGKNYGMALVHWLTHGITEGRRASTEFDPGWYLQNNPGLANYRAALVHWLTIGRPKGLKGAP